MALTLLPTYVPTYVIRMPTCQQLGSTTAKLPRLISSHTNHILTYNCYYQPTYNARAFKVQDHVIDRTFTTVNGGEITYMNVLYLICLILCRQVSRYGPFERTISLSHTYLYQVSLPTYLINLQHSYMVICTQLQVDVIS